VLFKVITNYVQVTWAKWQKAIGQCDFVVALKTTWHRLGSPGVYGGGSVFINTVDVF
jgi:hypothetical protein